MRGARSPSWRRAPTVGGWWAIASAVALLAVTLWLQTPRVEYLVVIAVATAAAAVTSVRTRGAQRGWALATVGVLAIAVAMAMRSQLALDRLGSDYARWQRETSTFALEVLGREVTTARAELEADARRALDAPVERTAAFAMLASLARGRDERGVVLLDHDTAFAWGGTLRIAADSLRAPLGVAPSEFYLTLYATAARGARRAVATVLLSAAPPADRLAASLAGRVAELEDAGVFRFTAPGRAAPDEPALRFPATGVPVFEVTASPLAAGEAIVRLRERARLQLTALLAIALGCFIIGAWRGSRRLGWRLGALAVVLASSARVSLNELSNLSRLFDPAVYYTGLGGSLTANAGALAVTSAIALLALLTILRRGRRPSRWTAAVVVLLVAGLGPFLLRDLARGIMPPTYGVSAALWLIWEIPLFLAAVTVLLAGTGAGGVLLGRSRGLPTYLAPLLAALAALIAPMVWEAPGQWPWWYTFVWIGAIAALALSRPTRLLVLSAATVAALGAETLVWGRTARGRVALAERDLASLSEPDPAARLLLERFGNQLEGEGAPATGAGLLQRFVASDLASGGFPTILYAWDSAGVPTDSLATARFHVPLRAVAEIVARARAARRALVTAVPADPATELVLAVPGGDGGATAVVVAPKTRLVPNDPAVRLYGLEIEPEADAPYTLQLTPADRRGGGSTSARASWRRQRSAVHGDWVVRTGTGDAHAHVEVELRSPAALVQRGTLIVLLDLAIVALLWTLSVVADGGFTRWLRVRRRTWGRSYRLRLTIALFGFFVLPAVAFAAWSYQQLSVEAVRSRDVLVGETLRAVAPGDTGGGWLQRESARLQAPLLLYVAGQLREASDPLLDALAPAGRYLREEVERLLVLGDEESTSQQIDVGARRTLFGFREMERPDAPDLVISSPARADDAVLGRGRRDLSIFVLFATVVGALGALWLSGIAARQLARPIGSLRRAALAIAAGERVPPLEGEPTVEFLPVFAAFRRMAADLSASRSALEEAQRRTAAILRNVASGVVAVDTDARVLLANPRADDLLGVRLPPGTVLAPVVPPDLAGAVTRFLVGALEDDAFELELAKKQLQVRLTRLARGGAVVTLDDVTELARAQRVLAWGEMARQVAHEIKNPLTPIRLGVQHLRRARADKRVDFDRVLDQNVNRILAEIDRLDEIARSFSRYGSAPGERPAAERTDVAAVVRDVVALETMAGDGAHTAETVRFEVDGADAPVPAMARADELREVLLNVFENARLAGARMVRVAVAPTTADEQVIITVRDDGHGIAPDVLPRIFEPHFSTRTSGSGLGLAISRQIIDGWGGGMTVESEVGRGTSVRIGLAAAR